MQKLKNIHENPSTPVNIENPVLQIPMSPSVAKHTVKIMEAYEAKEASKNPGALKTIGELHLAQRIEDSHARNKVKQAKIVSNNDDPNLMIPHHHNQLVGRIY